MIRRIVLAGAVSALALAAPALAQDMAITNATVAIGDGSEPVEGGTVVVRGGRIVAAGSGVAVPPGIAVIDAKGGWVTPGLVAAISDLGLADVTAVTESNDMAARGGPFSAALDIAPAINPASQFIKVSRAGGVTRSAVAPNPGGAIFAGQGAIIDLGDDPQAVTRARAFQYVELGEAGGRLGGGSRVSAHAILRNALREAGDFDSRAQRGVTTSRAAPVDLGDDVPVDPRLTDSATQRGEDSLLTRFDAAALIPVVKGQQPLYVHVERAADIRATLALKREFPALDLVIVGAAEGWMVADALAAARVPVIASALADLPAEFEMLAATQSNVGRMTAAGVRVAIGRYDDHDQPRYAPQFAGNLVGLAKMPGASGLTWGQALAAITSIPAAIMGMGERFGSLRPGLAGDVVIWDGDPLEVSSAPVAVYIDGVAQPLDSHQTRLRDRYRTPAPGDLPKGYDW